jgi:hypothetical protein
MNSTRVIEALEIPADARVDQRIPKKLLLEQGMPTAADKRLVQDGIEELVWIAALKPTNIGIPLFRDDVREYLEVAVLTGVFRDGAKPSRLIELIHREIPYPVVLITNIEGPVTLSLAHKRWSQGEIGKVIMEDILSTILFRKDAVEEQESLFLKSLGLSKLPNRNLFELYQGLLSRLAALEAARITGKYVQPESSEQGIALRNGLYNYAHLKQEIVFLREKANKEYQINRRVELNLEIKRLDDELAAEIELMKPENT